MTTSDDFLYLRKEIDRLASSSVAEKLMKTLSRIENAYRRHQDAIIQMSDNAALGSRLTRDDVREINELAADGES